MYIYANFGRKSFFPWESGVLDLLLIHNFGQKAFLTGHNIEILKTDSELLHVDPIEKELSLCNKLWCSNPYIFGFQCRRPLTFQTMTSVRSNNLSFKYQRFTTLGFKDIGIRKSEFVGKNQFLF